MKTKVPYDELPVIPVVIAQRTYEQPYKGIELSSQIRSSVEVDRIEALRQIMSEEQKQEFCELADKRCRRAYENETVWFMRCCRSDSGLRQLYIWASHWLASYLSDPVGYKTKHDN